MFAIPQLIFEFLNPLPQVTASQIVKALYRKSTTEFGVMKSVTAILQVQILEVRNSNSTSAIICKSATANL